jgi:hypothetical protein
MGRGGSSGGVAALSTPPEAADSTSARNPSKQIQIKPSKIAWNSLVLFVRIGTFQRVTREKIKKIDSRLKLCAKRLRRLFLSLLRPEAWRGMGTIGGRI